MTINPPVIPRYTMDWYLLSHINHHIDMLVERYSCLYALRFDLCYLRDSYRYKNTTSRSQEYEVRVLMAELDKHPAVVGYYCVMEWTEDHGFHVHAVIWLDSHITQKPFFYAEKAGSAWRDITQGEGHLCRCDKKDCYVADISETAEQDR